MKAAWLVVVAALLVAGFAGACLADDLVIVPAGPDTYMLDVHCSIWWCKPPADITALKKANEYCAAKSLNLSIQKFDKTTRAGMVREAQLVFGCVPAAAPSQPTAPAASKPPAG